MNDKTEKRSVNILCYSKNHRAINFFEKIVSYRVDIDDDDSMYIEMWNVNNEKFSIRCANFSIVR